MSDTRMIEMPLSDANDLDAVVHELGIEDSDTTPAEAVKELKAALDLANAELMASESRCTAARDELARLRDDLNKCEEERDRAEAEKAELRADNGRTKIFDHKWLDPQCIEMGCQSLILRGQRDEAINELTSALEILSVKHDAAKVEWRRLFDAMGELLNELGPDFDQGCRAYYDEMTALSQIEMTQDVAHRASDQIARVEAEKAMANNSAKAWENIAEGQFIELRTNATELAAMREALVKAKNFIYVNGQAPEDQELLNCIENTLALQSHRRTEEAT